MFPCSPLKTDLRCLVLAYSVTRRDVVHRYIIRPDMVALKENSKFPKGILGPHRFSPVPSQNWASPSLTVAIMFPRIHEKV